MKHNNVIPNVHLRKHWQKRVRTYFNQPANKRRRLEKRQAKAAALFPRPLEKLRPVVRSTTVRYNRKQRLGRGFTLQELKEAKLGQAFAQSIGITVDHRRQNRSTEGLEINKKRLLAYVSKLVLHPRVATKLKKGLVNDSKDIGAEVQNTEHKVLGLPAVHKREKGVKLTAELKKAKAYRVLRQELTNKKWKGKRDKKAKDAEGKKE